MCTLHSADLHGATHKVTLGSLLFSHRLICWDPPRTSPQVDRIVFIQWIAGRLISKIYCLFSFELLFQVGLDNDAVKNRPKVTCEY